MPTYEYRCKDCGRDLEVVQSFTDDPLTTCEACGGPLRKVFGNVGIAFKGSGFYKNDSRGKAASSTTTSDKGDKKSTEGSGGDSSTTAKPDTATSPAKKDAPAPSTASSAAAS